MSSHTIDLRLQPNQTVELDLEPPPQASLTLAPMVGERGPQGDPGPMGPSGGSYVHTQNTPSLVWTVQHNFGHRPAGFLLYDEFDNPIGGIVSHLNDNVALVTFLNPYRGKGYVS